MAAHEVAAPLLHFHWSLPLAPALFGVFSPSPPRSVCRHVVAGAGTDWHVPSEDRHASCVHGLPSSHTTAVRQSLLQQSPVVVLPSSHVSPLSRIALP